MCRWGSLNPNVQWRTGVTESSSCPQSCSNCYGWCFTTHWLDHSTAPKLIARTSWAQPRTCFALQAREGSTAHSSSSAADSKTAAAAAADVIADTLLPFDMTGNCKGIQPLCVMCVLWCTGPRSSSNVQQSGSSSRASAALWCELFPKSISLRAVPSEQLQCLDPLYPCVLCCTWVQGVPKRRGGGGEAMGEITH